MTAKELYNLILSRKLSAETCICRLHHLCGTTSICGKDSQIVVIDKSSIYIIVTDINPVQNALGALAMSLNVLANTSSQWEQVCLDLMNKKIEGISDMKTHYLYCEDFDNFYQSI